SDLNVPFRSAYVAQASSCCHSWLEQWHYTLSAESLSLLPVPNLRILRSRPAPIISNMFLSISVIRGSPGPEDVLQLWLTPAPCSRPDAASRTRQKHYRLGPDAQQETLIGRRSAGPC